MELAEEIALEMPLAAGREMLLETEEITELAVAMALETEENMFAMACIACIMPLKNPMIELTMLNIGVAELFITDTVAALAQENPTIASKISASAE
jgi:hypothetical protein